MACHALDSSCCAARSKRSCRARRDLDPPESDIHFKHFKHFKHQLRPSTSLMQATLKRCIDSWFGGTTANDSEHTDHCQAWQNLRATTHALFPAMNRQHASHNNKNTQLHEADQRHSQPPGQTQNDAEIRPDVSSNRWRSGLLDTGPGNEHADRRRLYSATASRFRG